MHNDAVSLLLMKNCIIVCLPLILNWYGIAFIGIELPKNRGNGMGIAFVRISLVRIGIELPKQNRLLV